MLYWTHFYFHSTEFFIKIIALNLNLAKKNTEQLDIDAAAIEIQFQVTIMKFGCKNKNNVFKT